MKSRSLSFYLSLIFSSFIIVNFFSCKTAKDIVKENNYIFVNHTDLKSYYIKIDSVDKSSATGRIYLINDELTLHAEEFSVDFKNKKCNVIFSDSSYYVLKIRRHKADVFEGVFVDS